MNLQEQISRIKNVIQMISESNYLTQPMKMGVEDDEVETLQTLLKIPATGEFDQETEDCVREFQTFTDIKIDGIVGPETRGKLNELLDDKIKGWLGCKKTIKSSEIQNKEGIVKQPSQINSSDIVGSSWRSCKAWASKGGLTKWGDKVNISASKNQFEISYQGPSSGLSIAHAKGGGDTIHQVYNILVCELNPYLAQGGMKPDINGITINGGKSVKGATLTIKVPLVDAQGVYQIDRRGGWNHNPGPTKMALKCKKLTQEGKICEGPVTKVVTAPFGKITEYFVTHQA
jgi:hypothetical protein